MRFRTNSRRTARLWAACSVHARICSSAKATCMQQCTPVSTRQCRRTFGSCAARQMPACQTQTTSTWWGWLKRGWLICRRDSRSAASATALEYHHFANPKIFIRTSSSQAAYLRSRRQLVLVWLLLSSRIELRTIFFKRERACVERCLHVRCWLPCPSG